MIEDILELDPNFPLDRVNTLLGFIEFEFETIYDS